MKSALQDKLIGGIVAKHERGLSGMRLSNMEEGMMRIH